MTDLMEELRKIQASGVAKPRPAKRKPRPKPDVPCDGCPGNGIYYGHGSVVNGVFVGTVGTCFRCGGKGVQNDADQRRNYGYDNFYRRISA